MRYALLYLRRSAKSDDRAVSLDVQEARCRAHVEAEGGQVVGVIRDDGVSGGKRERLDRIARCASAGGADAVVVYHLDRFARDTIGALAAQERLARAGVALHVAGRGAVEAQSSTGRLSFGVESLVAEHHRLVTSEKTKAAMARLAAEGRRIGSVPYGYSLAADGKHLVENLEERAIIALARELVLDGYGFRRTARVLTGRGYRDRTGAPFHHNQIRRMASLSRGGR